MVAVSFVDLCSLQHEKGDLVIGEHSEGVKLHFRGKARAGLVRAPNDPCHKRAVAQPIFQCWFMGPVCPFPAQ